MWSKNSDKISNDRSVKKTDDTVRKKAVPSDGNKNKKSFIEINKSNINKCVVKKEMANKNPFTNRNIKQAIVKQVDIESRSSLLAKINYLEEQLNKNEYEKSLIAQELDRVCEQRDNQMRQLKSELYEKQLEMDHQMSVFSDKKYIFEEELNKYKHELQVLTEEYKQKETDLLSKSERLEKELSDLTDYIDNREQTLAKIQDLEELVEQQKMFHNRTKEKLINDLENEKLKVGQLVNERVDELKQCLEQSCLSKLSIDARIALQKFEELSKNCQLSEKECQQLRQTNESLKHKIYDQRIHLEVSESLLQEFIKQMQRRLYNRKNIGIQSVGQLDT